MGAGGSIPTNFEKSVQKEFYRVIPKRAVLVSDDEKDNGKRMRPVRNYIVFEEMIKLKPVSGIPLDFCHLGTLYALDSTWSGTVSLDELISLTLFCESRRKAYKPHEYRNQLEGLFTLKLWTDIKIKGQKHVLDWLLKLVCQNGSLHKFERYPNQLYVSRGSILPLYTLLRDYMTNEIGFQELFDMLQHAGEKTGLLSLGDDSLDDMVPLEVVAELVQSVLQGFCQMMDEVGFPQQISAANLAQHFTAVSSSASPYPRPT